MSKPKSQHYVPRLLLKHFCDDGKTITVIDIRTKKTYKTNIINVAQENRFYDLKTTKGDVSLEKQFAELEEKAAPIIDEIVKTESIGWFKDEDFMVLEDLILCQFYRTRKSVNHMQKLLTSNNWPLFEHFDSDGKKIGTIYSNDLNIDDNVSKVMAYNLLNNMEHNDIVRDAIASMEWLLIKAPENKEFIVSDNPAVLASHTNPKEYKGENAGFELLDAQILLPISSKLLLTLEAKQTVEKRKQDLLVAMMSCQTVKCSDAFKCSVTGEAYVCSSELVDLFNETQKSNAERFVYGI